YRGHAADTGSGQNLSMGKAARAQSDRDTGGTPPARFDAGAKPQAESDWRLQSLESGRSVIWLRRGMTVGNRLGAHIRRPRFRRITNYNPRRQKRGLCTKQKPSPTKPFRARIGALLIVTAAPPAAGPVPPKLGGLSGDSPPRPPADVPGGPFPPQPPPVQYPG